MIESPYITTAQIGGVAYTAYTPTWTATGTAPAIGNATVVGEYLAVGKLVHCYGKITFGSTSTFGTGTYLFALPVTQSANTLNASGIGPGFAAIFDTDTNAAAFIAADLAFTTAFRLIYPATYLGSLSAVTNTAPWTWAVGDQIAWNFVYEAA